MKKTAIEINFFLFYREKIYLQSKRKIKLIHFLELELFTKKLTKTTQKIWQPAFESFLAARCKGPDKVNIFFESLPPKEHHHISLVEPPRSGHKLIFLSIFLYPVLETVLLGPHYGKDVTILYF